MANIQQEISSFLPEATFVEGPILEVSVPDAKWHDLALYLRDKLHFDYLVSIVGMDWGETLGCVYYLTRTADNAQVSVKVETADRENPLLHSVEDPSGATGFRGRRFRLLPTPAHYRPCE